MAYKGFFSETFAIEYGLTLSLIELWKKGEVKKVYERKNLSSHHYFLQPRWQQPANNVSNSRA